MKKLSIALFLSILLLFSGCTAPQKAEVPPEPLDASFVSEVSINCNGCEYKGIFTGCGDDGSTLKIASPEAVATLEFRKTGGVTESFYKDMKLSYANNIIPVSNEFEAVCTMLKKVGGPDYTIENGLIAYKSDEYALTYDKSTNKPVSVSENNGNTEIKFITNKQ